MSTKRTFRTAASAFPSGVALVAACLFTMGSAGRSAAQGFVLGVRHDYVTGASPEGLAVGDLDGDSHADIVTANSSGFSVSVFHGPGNGRF